MNRRINPLFFCANRSSAMLVGFRDGCHCRSGPPSSRDNSTGILVDFLFVDQSNKLAELYGVCRFDSMRGSMNRAVRESHVVDIHEVCQHSILWFSNKSIMEKASKIYGYS